MLTSLSLSRKKVFYQPSKRPGHHKRPGKMGVCTDKCHYQEFMTISEEWVGVSLAER